MDVMRDEAYKLLAAEIVAKAVEDWRSLIAARAWANEYTIVNKNFNEIRAFFKSEYCELLLTHQSIKPCDILRLLEDELSEAIAEDRPQSISIHSLRY